MQAAARRRRFKGIYKAMNKDEYVRLMSPIVEAVQKDGDGLLCFFFHKGTDTVISTSMNVDSLDALAFIQKIITDFGIEPEVLAKMQRGVKDFKADVPGQGKITLPSFIGKPKPWHPQKKKAK